MCILFVIQKWSRRVATMLPWLVLPLIGLWALSQLLPPAFRFEITSPRLACVLMLVVILFCYEILMPHLSAWRGQRNAQLRERKRFEAIELQKLRKTATRRCRNCSTPYRDQNPGGGRFMCSYCGHVSKRPILDVSLPPSMGTVDTGIIKDLVGKGGKILNGKAWNDNGWMCNQDWLENGNLIGGSVSRKSSYWRKNGSAIFGGDERCLAEKYSGVLLFLCKLLTSFLMSIRWLWRKIFRGSSSGENSSADADHQGLLAKRSESGPNGHQSRGEKARRKAEEKRQARLEREHLEEEERKQREEVARLVEERRRLRDEKMEAEKDRNKISALAREKESKREAKKKRQERRKEKNKGSSKSNSYAEELEKKACKDTERKRDCEKKNDIDRREQKSVTKSISTNGFNGGNAGTRYLDRMRGTLLSSSRAFSGGSFFGRGASTSNTTTTTTTKENKFNSSVDHVNDTVHRRDLYPPKRITGKASINGDDKSISRPVLSEPQPRTALKKSWQQLFTRSSSPLPSSNVNVISRPNSKSQSTVQSVQLQGQSSIQSFDNPISFGLPSPFSPPVYASGSTSGSLGFLPIIEPVFPRIGEGPHDFTPEEVFEDPCYVPDPISLLGPVSESLDNFHQDVGTVFGTDLGLEGPHVMNNVYLSPEVHKPSPIESPLSRLRMADEKLNNSNWSSGSSKFQDMHTLPGASEKGTWQMWNSSPLGQDGMCLGGGPASLFLHQELNRSKFDLFSSSNMEELLHLSTQKSMTPLFKKDDPVLSGTHSPRKVFTGNSQNGGPFSSVTNSGDPHPWLTNASFPPLAGSENHLPLKPQEECNQNDMNYGSLHGSTSNYSSEVSPANYCAKYML